MALDRDLAADALPAYQIDGEIGRGGWGVVLRGRHVALGRDVAIKQLPSLLAADESALARFVDEARIIGQLDHPHIVKVFDFVERDGTWLIVMEHLGGGTLWDRFASRGIRSDEAVAVALAMCSALDAAHQHGIFHRDIKPENILFSGDGTPRLSDFGIAKAVDDDLRRTRVGEVVGTPTYMSPEQATGDPVSAASDIYSLGVVLYEQLSGRLPFGEARTPTQQLVQHVTELPVPLRQAAPGVPPPIADAVMTALEKRPADRFASASAFGVSLAHAAGESYGAQWLQATGMRVMGGGRIEAAAHRGPTMGAPLHQPTVAHPADRGDHFRAVPPDSGGQPASDEGPAPTAPPGTPPPDATVVVGQRPVFTPADPPPSTPPPAGWPTDASAGSAAATGGHAEATYAVPAMSRTPGAAEPGPGAGPASAVRPDTPPPPTGAVARSDGAGDGPGGSRRPLVAAGAVAAALLVGVIAAVLLTRGGGDDTAGPGDATTTTPPAETTTTPDTGVAATTAPAATATTAPRAPRTCPAGARCAYIDDITRQGDSLVINWEALGWEPSLADPGFFHAHFFWDIYGPEEVGTNAATFGFEMGRWEITDQQPFVSQGELAATNRPAAANRICVTVATFAHAVVDPRVFDCVPIPAGI